MDQSRFKRYSLIAAVALAALASSSSYAGPLRSLMGGGRQQQGGDGGSDNAVTAPGVTQSNFNGRNLLVFAPQQLPPKGTRALVVVLHGGLGSAERIEGSGNETDMSMDQAAQKYGFVVAYLNGTSVGPRFPDRYGWNAGGGCCGAPYKTNTDDVGYVTAAIGSLVSQYGVDPHKVYGMGHSNGAMMTQRLMCETNVYASAVVVSGTLMTRTSGSCAQGRGKKILAIHGADDVNVPIAGGQGQGLAGGTDFSSEAATEQVWSNTGASYQLDVVKGADHKVGDINDGLMQSEGVSISEKAARFFGLAG